MALLTPQASSAVTPTPACCTSVLQKCQVPCHQGPCPADPLNVLPCSMHDWLTPTEFSAAFPAQSRLSRSLESCCIIFRAFIIWKHLVIDSIYLSTYLSIEYTCISFFFFKFVSPTRHVFGGGRELVYFIPYAVPVISIIPIIRLYSMTC